VVGGWQLAVGSWQLAVGGGCLVLKKVDSFQIENRYEQGQDYDSIQ
jgi:hypothetical protein